MAHWQYDPLQWLADQLTAAPARWRAWREHPAAPAAAVHVLASTFCAAVGWAIGYLFTL